MKTIAFNLEQILPARKSEDYLYTDVAKLAEGIEQVATGQIDGADGEVDFVLPASETDRPAQFVAQAAPRAAHFIIDGQSSDIKHININNNSTPNLLTAQSIVIDINANAQRDIIIDFAVNEGLTALDIYIKMGEGSSANIVLWQNAKTSARIFTHTIADLQAKANLRISTINIEPKYARNNLRINYLGENTTTDITGLYIAKNNNVIDNSTVVRHKAGHCECEQLYKGLVDDEARAAFSGLIVVEPHAQKTKANQVNRSMLLSKDARAFAKPQLEIYADDVRCNHGSTTGQIDKEQLFYMQARGIGEEEARRMLVAAFVCEIADRLPIDTLRDKLEESIIKSL